jgi:hypothetical protein
LRLSKKVKWQSDKTSVHLNPRLWQQIKAAKDFCNIPVICTFNKGYSISGSKLRPQKTFAIYQSSVLSTKVIQLRHGLWQWRTAVEIKWRHWVISPGQRWRSNIDNLVETWASSEPQLMVLAM